ncbi:transmembrane protein 56-B-like [Platysternon megacephalum]|uniref:Transmembrane protein 56-B-like n=1 Tax=Platysternon megacephalum TaxID=55544 RepID=A0A4D9E655_9SAUR|nr:transmembrane protein 56-B-like [Platysternon megacephalum]
MQRPGMAARGALPLPLLCLCLALASAAGPEAPFSPPLGDIGACQQRCGHPPGAARDAVLSACYRGCRLFSICHFVDASAELNTTRAECESACIEAYGSAEEQFGCTTGCRKQLPETQSRKDKSLELQPVSFSMFDLVSSFCNDIVSSAQSFISSTWTFYLQADDGKVVVFQSQPEIEYPVPEAPAPKSELMEKPWPVSSPNTLKPHTGPQEKLEKPPLKEPKSKTKLQHLETQQPEHDFLGCMSKRSGLPRWILAACLFLSIMVMLWLSCASLVTAPDQHVKTQPLSINGDKEYLEDLDGSAPFSLHPVIAVTICPADDNEEAGPLPVKVDLDKTVL